MSLRNIDGCIRIQGKTASLTTAKLAIFATDILWKSCLKFDLEQLFNSGLYNLLLFLTVTTQIVSIATNHKK